MSRYHSDLVADIEAFASQHDMPETTFGRRAMGDPHFMRDIRRDRCLRPESVEKVRRFMRDYAQSADEAAPGKTRNFAARESEAA